MDAQEQVFRSDAGRYFRKTLWLVAALQLIVILAVALAWIRLGRFPDFPSTRGLILTPPTLCALNAVVVYALGKSYPVVVTPESIRAYTSMGVYRNEAWTNIQSAAVRRLCGIPYVCITTLGSKTDLTVPVWLVDFPEFVATVERYAGESNVLAQVLQTI
ncbi:MAG: hypothetical protein JST35_12565 [Armatimonadetes bacterium]|nr:hypothetical protein [Armatimonadota bacterium]